MRNPTRLGFERRGPNLTSLLTLIFPSFFGVVLGYVIVMQQECRLIALMIAALLNICSDSPPVLDRYGFLELSGACVSD